MPIGRRSNGPLLIVEPATAHPGGGPDRSSGPRMTAAPTTEGRPQSRTPTAITDQHRRGIREPSTPTSGHRVGIRPTSAPTHDRGDAARAAVATAPQPPPRPAGDRALSSADPSSAPVPPRRSLGKAIHSARSAIRVAGLERRALVRPLPGAPYRSPSAASRRATQRRLAELALCVEDPRTRGPGGGRASARCRAPCQARRVGARSLGQARQRLGCGRGRGRGGGRGWTRVCLRRVRRCGFVATSWRGRRRGDRRSRRRRGPPLTRWRGPCDRCHRGAHRPDHVE